VLEAHAGGVSKTTAKIIKNHAILAGHRTGSASMFLHRRWLQKLRIKVQELNANLISIYVPYIDAYNTRSATRKAGASVQRAVELWLSQIGIHPLSAVRNVPAVIGTWKRAASARRKEHELSR
jgi:hypothetical protein